MLWSLKEAVNELSNPRFLHLLLKRFEKTKGVKEKTFLTLSLSPFLSLSLYSSSLLQSLNQKKTKIESILPVFSMILPQITQCNKSFLKIKQSKKRNFIFGKAERKRTRNETGVRGGSHSKTLIWVKTRVGS